MSSRVWAGIYLLLMNFCCCIVYQLMFDIPICDENSMYVLKFSVCWAIGLSISPFMWDELVMNGERYELRRTRSRKICTTNCQIDGSFTKHSILTPVKSYVASIYWCLRVASHRRYPCEVLPPKLGKEAATHYFNGGKSDYLLHYKAMNSFAVVYR